jgi:dienelactone hydrolase
LSTRFFTPSPPELKGNGTPMSIENEQVEARRRLYELLGKLPERHSPMSVRQVAVETRENYRLERLFIECNEREGIPALFLSPVEESRTPRPVILYNHASGDDFELGKSEILIGRGALQDPPYGEVLVAAGYSVLCMDMWGFGERRGRSVDSLFKEMLWNGEVLWGRMVYDNLRMVDYLVSRPDVDSTRIATMGLSSGSTMAWWNAALDERIKVCVDICCLTDYQALIDHDGLDGHSIDYFIPSLLLQFSTADINALIAPRAHLSLAGNYDPLTPRDGLDRIDGALRETYASLGASDKWQLNRYECGHFETAAMRADVMSFLASEL